MTLRKLFTGLTMLAALVTGCQVSTQEDAMSKLAETPGQQIVSQMLPTGQALMPDYLSVLDFGAKADGETDDTTAIQSAIDKAAETGGQVLLPAGRYLVAGSLNIKKGVTLMGIHDAPQAIAPLTGTIVMATGGRDNEDAPPLFEMGHSSIVRSLTVWYPEQKPRDIHPYPWTFRMQGFDNTIENVTLINSYNAIRTGPENNVRHRIRSVYGCALRRGIFVDNCTDIGRIENVQFHCHWWTDPSIGGESEPVYEYMAANFEAFVLGRTDWEYLTNNFVFPAKIGYRFIKTEKGASNGHLTGCGADSTNIAVQVDAIQSMGLLITGGQFVSFKGEKPTQLVVQPTNTGSVRLVNCSFWGPAFQNARIQGNGYVSFNNCYFSNWNDKVGDQPLISAISGRLQVSDSTFATGQISVELGPDVANAIIRGNNGKSGVRVLNKDNRSAIISENEAAPSQQK